MEPEETARFPDRESLTALQLQRLNALLTAVLPANRLYAAKLGGAAGPFGSLREFASAVPFTTKAELAADQRAAPPYGTGLTYPLERYVRFSQTSGTTGTPLRWLDTAESWSWMVDRWVEVLRVSGVDPGDRLYFAFSFGPFLGFWTAFDAGVRLGCLCLPGGGLSSAARLRAILDNEVTALCCTPTYALRLAESAAEEGIDLSASRVRALVVGGEAGAAIPATRARIESLWPGARVWDHHGMTEIGPVTYECPLRPGVLHVMESGFIPEVLDPATLLPVDPGAEGELVLTNLGRVGSPLIRYRTGDRVRPGTSPCACGRYELALEGGILGRTDDMVVVRGVNLYPSAVEDVLRRHPGWAEYRVEVLAGTPFAELRVELEPAPECGDPEQLAREVQGALRDVFSLRVPVRCVPAGTLPRFELKARRWVRGGPVEAL